MDLKYSDSLKKGDKSSTWGAESASICLYALSSTRLKMFLVPCRWRASYRVTRPDGWFVEGVCTESRRVSVCNICLCYIVLIHSIIGHDPKSKAVTIKTLSYTGYGGLSLISKIVLDGYT